MRNVTPLVLLFACAPVLATTPLEFERPVVVGGITGGGAISTAAGDFDGHGIPEIIRTRASGTLQLLRRSGDTWTRRDLITPGGRLSRYGGDTSIVDVNGDGLLDVVVTESRDNAGPGNLWWYQNPGGDLSAPWVEHNIATWDNSSSQPQNRVEHMADVEFADLDGDGLVDIVTRDVSTGVYLHFQQRTAKPGGGFDITWQQRFIDANPREGLQLGDVDGDGHVDITFNGIWWKNPGGAAARGTGYNVTADYARSGTDPFVIDDRWYPESGGKLLYATKQAVGDVNGDGLLDIVITNGEVLGNGGNPTGKPLGAILYLAGGGTSDDPTSSDYWARVQLETDGADLHGVRMGDLNGDGLLDIFTANSQVGSVHRKDDNGNDFFEMIVWLNEGDGQFTRQVLFDQSMYSGILIDADGDGDLDIIGPDDWNDGALRFYENVTVIPEPGTPAAGAALLAAVRRRRR
ncbi:MAG: FG-GAP repeat domain-containing protein [Phycisphaerae bacterium]